MCALKLSDLISSCMYILCDLVQLFKTFNKRRSRSDWPIFMTSSVRTPSDAFLLDEATCEKDLFGSTAKSEPGSRSEQNRKTCFDERLWFLLY